MIVFFWRQLSCNMKSISIATMTNQYVFSPPACPSGVRGFEGERRRSSSRVIKVSSRRKVWQMWRPVPARKKSESGTVRHVDSGVVMDGEWGKTDDIVCLRPCCHSGGLPLVLTSQYQRANWSLFTLLQWSDLEWRAEGDTGVEGMLARGSDRVSKHSLWNRIASVRPKRFKLNQQPLDSILKVKSPNTNTNIF